MYERDTLLFKVKYLGFYYEVYGHSLNKALFSRLGSNFMSFYLNIVLRRCVSEVSSHLV